MKRGFGGGESEKREDKNGPSVVLMGFWAQYVVCRAVRRCVVDVKTGLLLRPSSQDRLS